MRSEKQGSGDNTLNTTPTCLRNTKDPPRIHTSLTLLCTFIEDVPKEKSIPIIPNPPRLHQARIQNQKLGFLFFLVFFLTLLIFIIYTSLKKILYVY